ncbi:RES family NAD+ phosphorylase [Deinococcus sp. 23YEL01]|uniref:RES family NAD+ phosphorylase n=1 Tax=Deinococcus sp. 23YEL01 TaxID=2745871 RepID=UPI001E5931DB|nr:RES family NAD+ phosphorylase [Deinococcus sp. 23YEL01]
MSLTLHRISKLKYATLPTLDAHGLGAAQYGGRWNSPDPALQHDRRIIYTSDTLAQATLEVIVHVDSQVLHTVPHGHVTFQVDPDAIMDLSPGDLPATWNAQPETPATQVIGDEWYDLQASPVLRIPSAVLPLSVFVPGQANYLINTRHPQTAALVRLLGAVPLTFDPRL